MYGPIAAPLVASRGSTTACITFCLHKPSNAVPAVPLQVWDSDTDDQLELLRNIKAKAADACADYQQPRC